MLKKISLVAFVLLMQACAQYSTMTMGGASSSKVVDIPGSSQDKLFVRANNWMVDNFHEADSVIQFTDKESGTISGRYLMGVVTSNEYGLPIQKAFATIKISVRDDASRIEVTPQTVQYVDSWLVQYDKKDMESDVKSLLVSFEKAMRKEDVEW